MTTSRRTATTMLQRALYLLSKGSAAALLVGLTLCATGVAHSQVAPASIRGDETVFAGVDASGMHIQYGSEKLLGIRVFADANFNQNWGIEAAASFMNYHERNGVHLDTYVAGPRYSFRQWGRTTVAVKGLIGGGEFYFPYGFAQGSYFVVSPGADVSYRINRRVRWQVVDAEYQYWPQFTYGAMSTESISTGLRFRIF